MVDITLQAGNGFFNYRVGAIILHEDNLLMVKNENYTYYYSVGGRVNFEETSEEAVLREVYEETGIVFELDRLAFVHENFFVGGFKGNKLFHEISLFYLMKPNDAINNIVCNSVGDDGGSESLHWLPVNRLSDYPIFPEFFKTELQILKSEVGHFITKDGKAYKSL